MEKDVINIHAELIDGCVRGERAAQNEIYKLYSKAMFNIALRITNNRDDAEDALQESFASAFKNLKSYKGTATFGAWLKRIVINKAINVVKKKQVETVTFEEGGIESLAESDHDLWPEEITLSVEKIKRAVQLLPVGYRLVFSLYLLEGYDHQEIAEILGITMSTSKSQFNRSKKKIREILTREVGNV